MCKEEEKLAKIENKKFYFHLFYFLDLKKKELV